MQSKNHGKGLSLSCFDEHESHRMLVMSDEAMTSSAHRDASVSLHERSLNTLYRGGRAAPYSLSGHTQLSATMPTSTYTGGHRSSQFRETDYSAVCIPPSTSIRRMPKEAMVAGSSDDMRKAVNDKPTWKGRNMFVFAQLILVQMGTTRKVLPGRTGVKKWKRSNDPTRRGQADAS